jgi:prepilin-type processing-associated H-X9-DG protein
VSSTFPLPGTWVDKGCWMMRGWSTRILPQLEQTAMYNNWNVDLSEFEGTNRTLFATPLPVYACPSTPQSNPASFELDSANCGYSTGATATLARVDYLAPHEGTDRDGSYTAIGPIRTGVMEMESVKRMRDITDGTSNVIMLAECAGLPMIYRRNQPFPTSPDTVFTNDYIGHLGGANRLELYGWDPTGTTTTGGNGIFNRTNAWGSNLFSFHTGGAQVAMCDGSVRFLSESMNAYTVRILIDIKDGEVVGEF